jgi:hypothetical protein
VITITGWGEHPDAMATDAYADHLMVKPFDSESLGNCVNELLS